MSKREELIKLLTLKSVHRKANSYNCPQEFIQDLENDVKEVKGSLTKELLKKRERKKIYERINNKINKF